MSHYNDSLLPSVLCLNKLGIFKALNYSHSGIKNISAEEHKTQQKKTLSWSVLTSIVANFGTTWFWNDAEL